MAKFWPAMYQTLQNRPNKAAAETLKRISPLAWQHVDFSGRYRLDSDRPCRYGNPARRNWR